MNPYSTISAETWCSSEATPATLLMLSSADKAVLGQLAATIRGFRPPEPYGGKGIRYRGEKVRKKAGKAGKGRK